MDWKLLFSGKGRLGRADFWIAWVLLYVPVFVLEQFGAVGAVLAIIPGISQLCLLSKRLHDVGRSGWLVAWGIGVFALVGLMTGIAKGVGGQVQLVLSWIALGLLLAAFAVALRFLLQRGDPGENAYGPAPEHFVVAGGRWRRNLT